MSKVKTEIAIVMPAFNAEAYLADAIESVIAQTFTGWVLTIVDDGSSDETASIAEEYAETDERIHLRRQPNAGVSAARNHGYAMTPHSVEYVLFLDADDKLEPDALSILLTALVSSPESSAAYGLARSIDKAGVPALDCALEDHQRERMGVEAGRVVPWPIGLPTTFEVEAVMEYIITPGTVLIRRDALDQAGLFHITLRMWEDWDLWLRLCQIAPMKFVDQRVLRYRQHDAQASANAKALQDGEREVRRRLFESLADQPEKLRIAEVGYKFQQMHIARKRLAWAGKAIARAEVVPAVKQLGHAAVRIAGSLRKPSQPTRH